MVEQTTEWQKAQDQLKLLQYYDVAIIDGKEHKETEHKYSKRNHKEKKTPKNPILRFLKRCLYFKPKTFVGATILAAVLTTLSGAVITSCIQGSRFDRRHRGSKPVLIEKEKGTNMVSWTETQQMSQALQQLYTLYQFGNEWLIQNKGAVLTCQTCGDTVHAVKSSNGKDVQMTCITCQKPFQAVAETIKQAELSR